MELQFNGTTLSTDTDVKFNNISLDSLKINGNKVWEREPYTTTPYMSFGSQSSTGTYNNRGFVSADLASWTSDGISASSSSSSTSTGSSYLNLAYSHSSANGIHIAVDTPTSDHIVYTKGGVNWKSLTMPETVYCIGGSRSKLLYNGSFYVIINNYSAYKTTDFVNVTKLALPARADWDRLTCVNNIFFYLNEDDGKVYKSTDCETWTALYYTQYMSSSGNIYPMGQQTAVTTLPTAYYNGYYYCLIQKSSDYGALCYKFPEDFDLRIPVESSSRYVSGHCMQINNRLYWHSWTRNHGTDFISYLDASTDMLYDVINAGAYGISLSYERAEGNSLFAYGGSGGNMFKINDNGYQTITNPSGYYLKKIAYFGRTE